MTTRSRTAILSGILAALLCVIPAFPDADPGRALSDTLLHGLAGASGALFAASAAAAWVDGTDPRAAAGTAAGAALGAAVFLGLAKELLDLAGFGDPKLTDLACTVLGGLVMSAGAYALVLDQTESGTGPSGLAPPFACLGVVLSIPVADALIRRDSGTRRTRAEWKNDSVVLSLAWQRPPPEPGRP